MENEQIQNPLIMPLPPVPPPPASLYPPSNFEYILYPDSQKYIKDAYEVISRNEWWRPFREALVSRGVNRDGFTFTDDPFYSKIRTAICSTRIGGGHSGSSIGCVMRDMEFIALNGEQAYRANVINGQRRQNNL